jgi:hypothetical protein
MVGRKGYHLLDLDLGGEVLRYTDADVQLDITDNAGRVHRYFRGLVVSGTNAVSAIALDASVSCLVDDGTDWALIEAKGVHLELRSGIVRRWYEGQVLEQARIVLRGFTEGVRYETSFEPCSFAVRRSARRQTLILPRPGAHVDETTWPPSGAYSLDERIEGEPYPLIIGFPGIRSTAAARPGAAALLVQEASPGVNDLLLLAGHRIAATQVRIFDYTDGEISNNALVTVTHQKDALGRTCAICDLNGSGLTRAKGRSYYQGHGATGGGLPDPRTGEVLRGAVSVARHLLEAYSDMTVDGAQMDAAAEQFDHIKIDASIPPGNIIDWITGDLLPLLPASLVEGPRGIYLQVWRWDVTHVERTAEISADLGHVRRVSGISRIGNIRNEFSIHYRHDAASGQYRARAGLSAESGRLVQGEWEDVGSPDERVYASYLCAQSQARFTRQPAEDFSTSIVWDAPTAAAVLAWQADRDAFPRRVVQYEADSEWEWLPLGAVVRLTDSEVHLAGVLALVTDFVAGPSSLLLQLTIVDHPLTTGRAV